MTKLKDDTMKLAPVVQAGAVQKISRRRMLGLAIGTGIVVAGAAVGQSGKAKAHSQLTVEVAPNLLDTMREPAEGDVVPTGPFYSEGPIYPEGTLDEEGVAPEEAQAIGTFRCWGWFWDGSGTFPSGSANQSYEFDGLGEIQAQGQDMFTKAVTGGSGAFRDISGELIHEDINVENATFRATFTN